MSDNKAFVYKVALNGCGLDEDGSVHQTSPSWVLTVVSWKNRDTIRTIDSDILAVLDPYVIINDCIQLTTDSDKDTLTPSFTALLKITDTNYLTAIAPGDFVFVNMLNWEKDANRIAKTSSNRNPGNINGFNDGFKGFFKVQGVREVLAIDPQTGTKTLFCKINGFGFTEFNNTIYFNPNLVDPKDTQLSIFNAQFGETFNQLIAGHLIDGIGFIITTLITTFIGTGPQNQSRLEPKFQPSKNTQFLMPAVIGKLLDIENVSAAKDVYNYIFGVQSYSNAPASNPGKGFNPTGLSNEFGVGFKNVTGAPCQGNGLLKPEYWNQVKAWDILNQYTNSPLNEMYTCFRTDTDGDVMPTVVFRQIPFTTQTLSLSCKLTKFMTLPRWYISPALITTYDIGRDESARINFVQCYAKSSFGADGIAVSTETAQGNYLFDREDVRRSGLRPYIFNSTMDEIPQNNRDSFRSPIWAKIIGDAVMGGHLKLNGTITCIGIVEPICVGDNLELNDVVYHIEQVTHTCNQEAEGKKTFRTTLALSHGVSVSSSGLSAVSSKTAAVSGKGNLYAEMKDTNAQKLRVDDYKFNKLLPGTSEAQDILSRTNVDVATNGNHPFNQPNTPITTGKPIPDDKKKK